MQLFWLFTLYMTFVYAPFDIFFKDMADAEEVWFGILLTGTWARVTEPLHWLIYGLGAFGFWKMKPWMHPWAGLYVVQIAIAMAVYNLVDPRGQGIVGAAISFAIFMALAVVLWQAKDWFKAEKTESNSSVT